MLTGFYLLLLLSLYACVFYVLRASPRKHRVCRAVLAPRLPLEFCTCVYVLHASPHKHRVCAVLARRFPLERFPFGTVPFGTVPFWNTRVCFLCFACFASQTPGLPCSARTSVPFRILHVCVYVLRALPRKHWVCAVLFPRPLLSLYAGVFYVLRASPRKHRVCRAVLVPRFPLEFCKCVFMFCVLRLANTGFMWCFSLGPF